MAADDDVGSEGYYFRMVTRIGPSKPIRHFLKAWRKHRHLTQQELANRLETSKDQISRWERDERGISMDVQAALAEALSIEPPDLFRDPRQPTVNDLMKRLDDGERGLVLGLIESLAKRHTGTGG